MQYNYVNGTL